MNEKIEALKTKIRDSFSNSKPPAKQDITVCDCWECLALREDFSGLEWQTLNPEIMERNQLLSLFSAEGLHYFLPAYLLHALNNFSEDSDFLSSTIISLTPGKEEPGDAEYSKDKFRLFTDAQLEIVFEFLDLIREIPEMDAFYVSVDRRKKRLLNYLKR